ncbi:MAG: hypothetical protein WDM79_00160 [Terricaulis sp.]
MRRAAAVTSFLALVTGCGEQPSRASQSPASAPPTATSAPTPAAANPPPDFNWGMSTHEEEAGLWYSVAETDAVGVSLHCGRGSRSVRVTTSDPNRVGTRLVFGSGRTQADVSATPVQDEMIDESVYAVATVPLDHPVLSALRSSGELWVWDDDHPMRSESESERADIAAFFRYCRE